MKKIFLLILLVLPVLVYGQSAKSKQLFKIGMALYNSQKYEEAIPFFQKSDSLNKAQLKETDPNYYRSDLKIANCLEIIAAQSADSANYAKAISMETRAMEIFKTCGEENADYINAASCLAEYYRGNGKYKEAINLETKVSESYKKTLGEKHPKYALSLSHLAKYYASNENFDTALSIINIAIDIQQKTIGNKHPDYANSLKTLAHCNASKGNYSEAIKLESKARDIFKQVYGENNTSYANSLGNLARYYYKTGNYNEAIQLGNRGTEINKELLGGNHPNYALGLSNVALYYANAGKYSDAIKLATTAMIIQKNTLGEEHPNYVTSLNNIAYYYSRIGKYSEALNLATTALEIQKKVLGENHSSTLSVMTNIANYNAQLGNYTEAIRIETKVMETRKKIYGENNPDYATSLYYLAQYNAYIGNYPEALHLSTIVSEIYKKNLGENHPNYAYSLNDLANYYSYNDNYDEAIKLSKKAASIILKKYGEQHPNYATILSNTAKFYSGLGEFYDAASTMEKVMEIQEKTIGKEHPSYIGSQNNLAYYQYQLGNYTEAINLATIATEKYKQLLGENHPTYATAVNNLAMYNNAVGNSDEAVNLAKIVAEIRKKVVGEQHPSYAEALINLASYYFGQKKYTEAIQVGTMAMDIYKNTVGENHTSYATAISNVAKFYSINGNYTEAIALGTKAIEIYKSTMNEWHPKYATLLSNLAEYNFYAGNYPEAVTLATNALDIRKICWGKDHPSYITSLFQVAQYQLSTGIINLDYFRQSLEKNVFFILSNFTEMTYKERTNFWNKFSDLYNNYLPLLACSLANRHKYAGASAALAYDGQVLSKGLILNSELEMQKIIEKTNNTILIERYNKIRNDRVLLDKLRQTAPGKRKMNTDSLRNSIEQEEKQFQIDIAEYGDYSKNLAITWTDIKKKLKPTDLAIEFAMFTDTTIKQEVYIALVLKKGMSSPEMVKLFTSDTLKALSLTDIYKTPKLYNILWQPLSKYLKGVKNVYFSPCGLLHTIGIEYLCNKNDEIFSNQYAVYRLTSTRELALGSSPNTNLKAATFGGISYDYIETDKDNTDDERGGGASFLNGTKEESEAVAKYLRSAKYDVIALSDTAATEESFKNLSGSGLKILHIGTHGFYYTENEMQNIGIGYLANDEPSREDKALSCSGLLFAGANTVLSNSNRSAIPNDSEEGILTAKEISRLDFKGLDLVVLSACQTGLGEVTSEGVFGLQRGFKKAGAQTIVMSLWNVSDKATQLLMTEFFKNLSAGMTKRAAFVAAQSVVRQKYQHPGLWAAFVMIDGIE